MSSFLDELEDLFLRELFLDGVVQAYGLHVYVGCYLAFGWASKDLSLCKITNFESMTRIEVPYDVSLIQ